VSSLARTSIALVILTLVGAALGGWAGVHYGLREARAPAQLDELLHRRLHLSADQNRKLEVLETTFAGQRAAYAAQLRAANRDIARAITVRHQFDDQAQAAVDRLHHAMVELQSATIQHVLAMRALLTPDQAREFDRTVDQALSVGDP
jgi:Spy/CpxP family protein refolding chaperone